MGRLIIQEVQGPGPAEQDVEIVERKGIGHPDTICDSVMEHISLALTRAYRERFGRILHHNCDKCLLAAGQVERRLGGGKVIAPMRLIIGDRATSHVGGEGLGIEAIAIDAAKDWFRIHLKRVDPEAHIRYQVELKPGSEPLDDLFETRRDEMPANDTSAAVGYAPMSETEQVVLDTERFLNASEFKTLFPDTGEDVKIMGVRSKNHLSLTVAMPFLDRYIESEADYFKRKAAAYNAIQDFVTRRLREIRHVDIALNTLDRQGSGMAGMYLSVLGTSAEDADSGQVGRGNQVNGVISLNRPRGSEAAPGKNPVSHIGKIYTILSHVLAQRIQTLIPGIREVSVWLYARIGDPVERPGIASVQVTLRPGFKFRSVEEQIRRLFQEQFSRFGEFCEELAAGRYPVC